MDDLRGMDDAIPETGHRLEGVVDAERRVAEMLDLLQHWIGQARHIGVAAEEQQRQAVGVRDRRRGQHVRRARPSRGGREHKAFAQFLLSVGYGRHGHRLLVLAAPQRELGSIAVQRLAEADDIAMAEDGEAAGA
jgi:hypothetical protein